MLTSYFAVYLAIFAVGFTNSADSYPCNGWSSTVNPPTDLTKPYYWPPGWDETQAPPSINIDLHCSIWFNIPKGVNAKMIMKGKVGGLGIIILNDNTKYTQYLHELNFEPFIYGFSGFNVTLKSIQSPTVGTLGIKVVWDTFPTNTPSKMKISNGSIHSQQAIDAQHGLVFTTDVDSKISLVPSPNNTISQNSLRNTLVFDGPSYYTNYAGNLYEIMDSQRQFISTHNSLTVFTFEPQNTLDMFVVQDYRDTMDVDFYVPVVCDHSGNCPLYFEGNYTRSVAVSVSAGGEILKSGEMEYDGHLSVYSGVVRSSNLLDTFDAKSIRKNLPKKYSVSTRQYVIDQGIAFLNISRKLN